MGRPTAEQRAAAIADFYAGDEPATYVAARHGIPRSTFAAWVNRRDDFAYCGTSKFDPTAWEVRGGVLYPLFPERRSA